MFPDSILFASMGLLSLLAYHSFVTCEIIWNQHIFLFRLGNPAGMLQTCFALLFEFFVACLAKRNKKIQLYYKEFHPMNAPETWAGQSICVSAGSCLSHHITCWILRGQ